MVNVDDSENVCGQIVIILKACDCGGSGPSVNIQKKYAINILNIGESIEELEDPCICTKLSVWLQGRGLSFLAQFQQQHTVRYAAHSAVLHTVKFCPKAELVHIGSRGC